MVRLLAKRMPFKRFGGVPVLGLLAAVEVAMIAREHVTKLDGAQRRRLIELVRQARGRPGSLSAAEQEELDALVARLEPRAFAGSAAQRLSPVSIPKRLLYGPNGTGTRPDAGKRR